MTKKNILFLIPELGEGGAERSLILLANKISLEHNVNICVFKHNPTPYNNRVHILTLERAPNKTQSGKIGIWVDRMIQLKKIKNQLSIDITISFLEGANYLNAISRVNDSIFLSVRGSKISDADISGFTGLIRKKILIPFLYRKSDLIITVSKAISQELNKYFKISKNKLLTIPNFYEIDLILEKSKEELSKEEDYIFSKKVIIHSGRFHKQKEHEGLLNIFSLVVKEMPCRLVLLGDGMLKEHIIKIAEKKHNLSVHEIKKGQPFNKDANVYIMGYTKNPFKYINKAHLFINSSSWEGFPNALTEAMICGTPVISTDCPTGPREIFESEIEISAPPTKKVLKTANGSLMPLLSKSSSITNELWKEEIIYHLSNHEVIKKLYSNTKLTVQKYNLNNVIGLWLNIIN